MNWLRFIKGFLLSFVFLFLFGYLVFAVQYDAGSYLSSPKKEVLSADISAGLQNNSQENALVQTGSEIIALPVSPEPAPEINALSAVSVESNLSNLNKIIFDKNSTAKLPIASLTKLMSAVIVLDNYDLSKSITIDKFADAQDPIKQDVKLGDMMTAENFLDIMLIESSNKSAYALSEVMGEKKFVDLMNQKSKDIGLENTFFADPTGLSSENVSTAIDLSKLAEYILENYPKIVSISRTKELDVPGFGKIDNTDELLSEFPEAVCSKTGFTLKAKGCLLLVINNQKNNDYLINIVLGADDRFGEMKKLINFSSAACNVSNQ